ncbi:hypothetical protein POM88_027318 [Heracleum sosnowskyi]|uniref:DUF4371 domain-containing protein n=1 Tax=Heracleum sosnowskyi TaxID=360622 RepID=A0AAD8I7J7_9APIA|nr:hypothetical protein POM88_027318 [Heracleum sosnowskyi]
MGTLEKYFPKRPRNSVDSESTPCSTPVSTPSISTPNTTLIPRVITTMESDIDGIESDPGLRKPIEDYDIGIRYRIRREYISKGLAFRGHDESSSSMNRGNFLEFLVWYNIRNKEIAKVVTQNAPGNNQLTSPMIQKQMTNACVVETTLAIKKDLGDNLFTILVDESRDISVKEQMAVVLRYVNKHGEIIERFLALKIEVDVEKGVDKEIRDRNSVMWCMGRIHRRQRINSGFGGEEL